MGGKEGSSHGVNVLVLDDGGTLNTLDDWLANNGGWDGVWDGLGNVDWGGDLNDLLNWLDDIIGNIVRLGDLVGFVDDVGLLLDGDNGRVDLGGAPESGGNSDVEVGDGWGEKREWRTMCASAHPYRCLLHACSQQAAHCRGQQWQLHRG